MLHIASDSCYPPFCMFILAYSANHLTEIEENIYKICHIKCVSEFLHYE